MKIEYKQMRIYKLYRSTKLDHEKGRPAIFLKFLGNQSLIWTGTSQLDDKAKDEPLVINLNSHKTHFYDKELQKVSTKTLMGRWKNNKTGKIYVLNDEERITLVNKFIEFTKEEENDIQKINT